MRKYLKAECIGRECGELCCAVSVVSGVSVGSARGSPLSALSTEHVSLRGPYLKYNSIMILPDNSHACTTLHDNNRDTFSIIRFYKHENCCQEWGAAHP